MENYRTEATIINIKSAFTLAEVLLTLTVIGIVASMTIPALISNTQQQELKTAYKKAYGSFSQLILTMKDETGGYGFKGMFTAPSDPVDCWNPTNTYCIGVRDVICQKMNCLKKYDQLRVPGTTTFQTWYDYDKHNVFMSQNSSPWGNGPGGILSDGTMFNITAYSASCKDFGNGCARMVIDVNGNNKAPNEIGKDVYAFELGIDKLYPVGSSSINTCGKQSSYSGLYGEDCNATNLTN